MNFIFDSSKAWRKNLNLLFCSIVLWLPCSVQAQQADEVILYQLKASYIYNILQFVYFPDSLQEKLDNINFCLLGEDRFNLALDEIDGSKISQATLNIIRLGPYQDTFKFEQCQMLYVVNSERNLIQSILQQVDKLNVLVIGESEGFIRKGGLIELFIGNDQLKFKVNFNLLQSANYSLAAQLLQLAANQK